MQIKIGGKCYLDIAVKRGRTEYLVSFDLSRWALFQKGEEPGTGYQYVQILCFRMARLKRDVFDQWVDDMYSQVMGDISVSTPAKTPEREDVM